MTFNERRRRNQVLDLFRKLAQSSLDSINSLIEKVAEIQSTIFNLDTLRDDTKDELINHFDSIINHLLLLQTNLESKTGYLERHMEKVHGIYLLFVKSTSTVFARNVMHLRNRALLNTVKMFTEGMESLLRNELSLYDVLFSDNVNSSTRINPLDDIEEYLDTLEEMNLDLALSVEEELFREAFLHQFEEIFAEVLIRYLLNKIKHEQIIDIEKFAELNGINYKSIRKVLKELSTNFPDNILYDDVSGKLICVDYVIELISKNMENEGIPNLKKIRVELGISNVALSRIVSKIITDKLGKIITRLKTRNEKGIF